jgi:LPXTG-site transpeptidase (sortase) family protein
MKKKYHISLIIMMLSLALFGSYHIYYSNIDKKSDELISKYIENNDSIIAKEMVNEIDEEDYLGILEIPKINLNEGFYNKYSKNNNINKSVTILKESIMPENNNSIIYLAAHSGNSPVAFFKDLNKLNIEDNINLLYKGNTYQYTITDIYEIEKNGNITVNRNIHENYLVLTTCGKNNMQIIIVSKLYNKV